MKKTGFSLFINSSANSDKKNGNLWQGIYSITDATGRAIKQIDKNYFSDYLFYQASSVVSDHQNFTTNYFAFDMM